jgi:hypothetical protein
MTEPSAGERSCGGGRSQFAIPIGSLDLERSNCIRVVFANNNLNVTEGVLRHLFLDGGSSNFGSNLAERIRQKELIMQKT